ncbi:GNAT family N-acetyltransferase [Polluticoccus soli]|uniref:GNAT family N-acetyltransferase n=1 Tax=Polluticoccus soli TaxID=3034150 RepID=UPI0023E1BA14|nr:GNAT family N-acetyltransferase [Flavipsychrobacter sp. JY13-12]
MTNKEQYRAFCSRRNDLPPFLCDWWMDATCDDWDVAIEKNGDNIAGVWPYAISKRIGVELLRNARLSPYQGPFVSFPADLKESNRDGFEHETISAMLKQIPSAKVWNLALQPGIRQVGMFRNAGMQVQVQQTFLIDLHPTEQELLSNMKENLRRNIRAAEKEFDIADSSEHLNKLYEYQKHTLTGKGAGQPYSLTDMQKLMDACMQHNTAALWVAKKGGEIQALVWNVWSADTSYYFMGSQKPGGDSYRAITALLWHSIKEAKQRGNKTFDLEGSMDAGVEKFFRSFGGRRELYLVLKKNHSFIWKLKELVS